MTGQSVSRSAEDIDQSQLSAAEAKSLATNNPLILEKLTLDKRVMELQLLQGSWQSAKVALLQKVETTYPKRLDELNKQLPLFESDREQVEKEFQLNQTFSMELNGITYTDRKEALQIFNALLPNPTKETKERVIGAYKGFTISVNPSQLGQVVINLKRSAVHQVAVERQGTGSITRIDNVLKAIPERLNNLKNESRELSTNLKEAEKQLEKPFEQAEELDQLLDKQSVMVRALEKGQTSLPKETIKSPEVSIQVTESQTESASNQLKRI